jgi:hypothetical protein
MPYRLFQQILGSIAPLRPLPRLQWTYTQLMRPPEGPVRADLYLRAQIPGQPGVTRRPEASCRLPGDLVIAGPGNLRLAYVRAVARFAAHRGNSRENAQRKT